MAVHRHENQEFLNRLGHTVTNNYAYLTYAGTQPDGRYWTRDKGVCGADGVPLNQYYDEESGETIVIVSPVRFSPIRVAPDGTIYGREMILDQTGSIVEVTPEVKIAEPTGTSVFQQFGDNAIIPIKGAAYKATDAFFEKVGQGYRARTDFTNEDETIFMKAEGTDIQLKALEGAIENPDPWDSVNAAFTGNVDGMSFGTRLTGKQYGALSSPDSVPVVLGMRVLLDQQMYLNQNGIYTVTRLGDSGSTWELTRSNDANIAEQFVIGKTVRIDGGVIRMNQVMRLNSEVIDLGSSNVVFISV